MQNWKVYVISAIIVAVVFLGFQQFGHRSQKETLQSKVLSVSLSPKTGIERNVEPSGDWVYYDDYRTPGYDLQYYLSKDGILSYVEFFLIRGDFLHVLAYYSLEDNKIKSVSGNTEAIRDPTIFSKATMGVPTYFWSKSPEGKELQKRFMEVMLKYHEDHPKEKLPELKVVT
jgi:hypothetical protein